MKFHKTISVIFHPIVLPTIGALLYFFLISNNFNSKQKFAILGLIFTTTYLIPLLILIILKKIKLLNSFKAESIKERRIPVALMVVLFYLLGSTLNNIPNLRDLGLLFFGTSTGLIFIYLLFIINIKASIHLLSLGISISFLLILAQTYAKNLVLLVIVFMLLSGLLASARLHLNAHSVKEVYLGFFIGILSPFLTYYLL